MSELFLRTQMLLGKEGMDKLHNTRVAVFGIGGVGGYTVEALVRSGIGTIDIFDDDKVSVTNLNRQIIATMDTVGRYKVDVMKERALSVNPDVVVNTHKCFYMPDNADEFDFSVYSYIVDAIDTVTGKIEIITRADKQNIPVISCMGAGNKLDAAGFEVADIYDTSVCPLARTMRRELKKRGVKSLKVVYSKETPISPDSMFEEIQTQSDRKGMPKRIIPGSTAFVPAVTGLIAAGEVIRDLSGK
ncbi:MAG: tRNA threonylcarbamoyladenosine dehydratase [Clostridia bacterium]|nr:tRNA threonylcarbamoyladenosine dehydratase [Clostridia bacterium]